MEHNRDAPFFPESCNVRIWGGSHAGLALFARPPDSIYTNTRKPRPQKVHAADWKAINATCRRIRRLAHESFLGTKTIVMTWRLGYRIRKICGTPTQNNLDGTLILHWVRSIALLIPRYNSPASVLMKLPKILVPFTRLRRCTLMIGFEDTGDEPQHTDRQSQDMPAEMKQLLYGIGVREGLEFTMALFPRLEWDSYQETLVKETYPMLRLRGELLAARGNTA